jgi:hypothetical protein
MAALEPLRPVTTTMSQTDPGSALAGRTLTFLALGGSGIRAVEPLLHLCALGLGPRQLRLALIDPDQNNGAVKRTRELIDQYVATRAALGESGPPAGYFRTEVVDAVGSDLVWSPIADDENLPDARFATRVDRTLMRGGSEALGNLFDLLYAERVRRMDLGMGFRGVPSIGTVFMNRLREEPFFAQMLAHAQANADTLFFAVGSIFGGTGSAAFPVVGRALADGVRGRAGAADVPGVPLRRIGGAVLLPYFTLPAPSSADAPDGGPRPETALFAQNAAAAIPTYTHGQAGYGGLYVLGDALPREQERNEVGGEAQANRAHYVELFSALAALDFAARGGEEAGARFPIFRATAVDGNEVDWDDLPVDAEAKARLMGGIVAAHAVLTLFRPNGGPNGVLGDELRGATWTRLLKLDDHAFLDRSAALDGLAGFFMRTWQWLSELERSDPGCVLTRWEGRLPLQVRPDELIGGRHLPGKAGREHHHVFHVFRHWNVAAFRQVERGFPAFLETMRLGSESYARARFPENSKPSGAR